MTTSTDWWPEQSGRLTDGLTIMCNCEASATITEGAAVKFGTSTASSIRVQNGAAIGDSWGIAMKAASTTNEGVPVVVYGLYKMATSGAVTQGKFVMNTATPTQISAPTITTASLVAFGGNSYILGMAMQTATGTDNIIVFIGKSA